MKAYPDHSEQGDSGTEGDLSWRYTTCILGESQSLDDDV